MKFRIYDGIEKTKILKKNIFAHMKNFEISSDLMYPHACCVLENNTPCFICLKYVFTSTIFPYLKCVWITVSNARIA